jgi:hypothetical protein
MSTAPHESFESRVCTVQHPFHPLFEREIEIVTTKLNWSVENVFFYDKENHLISMPLAWTSLYEPSSAVRISSGRSAFIATDLLELHRLINDITSQNPLKEE